MSVAWPPPLAVRLVEQDPGVRQREALALGAGGQQHGGGRRGLAEADRGDVGLDVLHRVVDREQRRDVAAGAVDVDVDVLVGVLRLEVQQLGADQVGDRVVDRRAQEDDVLLEQPGVEVEGPLAAVGLLDDRGDQVVVTARLRLGHRSRSVVRWRRGSVTRRRPSVPRRGARLVGRRPRGLDARAQPGRSALPSSSTISTCSMQPLEGLALAQMSERTAGTCPLRSSCLRTCAGFWPTRSATRGDLGLELLVGDLDAPRPRPRPAGRGRP